jgi:MoaA/NifB/PqqE/SkfB family radical SAM enzyme
MKAKVQQRINLDAQRTPLEQVLPLSTPFVLMIDPSSTCNFRCRFCPTGDTRLIQSTGRYQGFMKLDLFKKIITDLDEFDTPIKVLRLYKEGEPLVNPHLPEMIHYARQSSKVLRIDTTTNGAVLKPELNRRLIDAGIDQINISVNGIRDEQFLDLTRARVNFSKYLENIRDLYDNRKNCTVYIKAIYENMTSQEREQFLEIFGDVCDRIYFEHLQPNWPGFHFDYIQVDYEVGHYGQELRERQVCPFIFYMIVVNSDGSVSLCVQDWGHKLVVGETTHEKLRDIWLGKAGNAHRRAHLEMRRCENPVCAICPVMKHGVLDDIDAHAPNILEKFLPLL